MPHSPHSPVMVRLAHPAPQPYHYPPERAFVEPDWRRLPGFADVTEKQWRDAVWQRKHCVKNLAQLSTVFGPLMPEDLLRSIEADMRERATMSMLVPPHMLNTMDDKELWHDPIRRYMLPALDDRHPVWPNHPMATRDSLHESDMWVVEGLTHRYPTKVLAELLTTCPQYCGHCTRMDIVGNDVPQIEKARFNSPQKERHQQILDYLKSATSVRDVVVSGGDIANLPPAALENFVMGLLGIEHIRDIRLATKGLMALPQHFLQDDMKRSMERIARTANDRGVDVAIHTHVNHANSCTPLVAEAVKGLLDVGFRHIRNQGVLLRGVNGTTRELLDLCFTLLDHVKIMPYYFYMCDMIPNAEHWRLALYEAHQLQHEMMGYLPGFATPRIVCDVPYVGKRWVHQKTQYDRELGISYWTKNYRTSIELADPDALTRTYEYYDPVYTLPESGREWWLHQMPRHTNGATPL